jgi:hypothetical protein
MSFEVLDWQLDQTIFAPAGGLLSADAIIQGKARGGFVSLATNPDKLPVWLARVTVAEGVTAVLRYLAADGVKSAASGSALSVLAGAVVKLDTVAFRNTCSDAGGGAIAVAFAELVLTHTLFVNSFAQRATACVVAGASCPYLGFCSAEYPEYQTPGDTCPGGGVCMYTGGMFRCVPTLQTDGAPTAVPVASCQSDRRAALPRECSSLPGADSAEFEAAMQLLDVGLAARESEPPRAEGCAEATVLECAELHEVAGLIRGGVCAAAAFGATSVPGILPAFVVDARGEAGGYFAAGGAAGGSFTNCLKQGETDRGFRGLN